MKKDQGNPMIINSIADLHRLMGLPKPMHTLITLVDHRLPSSVRMEEQQNLILNFYNISIKRNFRGHVKYGRNYYDFDKGTMTFAAPNQVIACDSEEERSKDGWSLMFHPDLIRKYPLAKSIKNYGFFAYDVHEALHLSDEEDSLIENLASNIEKEYRSRVDSYSADVIVSTLGLLLNYCNRFYNRQFITRKTTNNDLLLRFDNILLKYFKGDSKSGLPSVNLIAQELNVSQSYLSDMLRAVTGQNAQQHIHNRLIEDAKTILTSTDKSVAEIAFLLGFEYPQSFNKLFKKKTNQSPLKFRQSFDL